MFLLVSCVFHSSIEDLEKHETNLFLKLNTRKQTPDKQAIYWLLVAVPTPVSLIRVIDTKIYILRYISLSIC